MRLTAYFYEGFSPECLLPLRYTNKRFINSALHMLSNYLLYVVYGILMCLRKELLSSGPKVIILCCLIPWPIPRSSLKYVVYLPSIRSRLCIAEKHSLRTEHYDPIILRLYGHGAILLGKHVRV